MHPHLDSGLFLFYNCCMLQKLIVASFFILLFTAPTFADAALLERVNEAFQVVHGRDPIFSEWEYWARRVHSGDKKTFEALAGAIAFHKAHNVSPAVGMVLAATSPASSAPATSSFKADRSLYPSSLNPNFLPNGTLIKSPSKPEVFYIKHGKRSWILPNILDRWLGENHYFKSDIIITVSDADLARYPQTTSVNQLYSGKVLKHPDGTHYYIDDKLRKRKLSSSVRAALKFPAGNLYATSEVHLREFKTGPPITRTDMYPGGMVVYDGPFHGGSIWRIEEVEGGKLAKRLFLSDYIYEASGYPDENQRVAVDATHLSRYERRASIERYPNGWVVGLGVNIYVVQGEALRLITSPELFNALGYKQKYVLKVHPEFLKRYPHSKPIGAYKNIVAGNAEQKAASTPTSSPTLANSLNKVRSEVRQLIAEINELYLIVFDKEPTTTENKFWVDYVYNGEVDNKADLLEVMKRAREIGSNPARTPRTTPIDIEKLQTKWFSYLFYFVHQQEPSEDARDYWYSRIKTDDRDTIEKLGGTIQWLKDTTGKTYK